MAFKLNKPQQEAVDHKDGPLLILAGAGSGKTRVITSRIAKLIASGVPPAHILAVTFTNKAAKEMRERVISTIGDKPKQLVVSTFHAFCLRVLKLDIERLGYKKNFTIYNMSDQRALVRNVMKEVRVNINSFDEGLFLNYIDRWKNKYILPNEITPQNDFETWAVNVYRLYMKYLKGYNAVDFNDLINLVIELFEQYPEVLERYRERFRYIMIDEYQDTNPSQYKLAMLLAAKYRNLAVVGDDDQSIYGFRGSDVSIILSFEKDFPEAKIIRLEENYRSTASILNVANELIAKNESRRAKKLFTSMGDGKRPRLVAADDDRAEAVWVAEDMMQRVVMRSTKYSDAAVLFRMNAQSRPFEEEFRVRNIPYTVVGAFEFYERKEVKDVLAYLKLFVNPEDDVSFLRIINFPRRGIGDGTVTKLTHESVEKNLPLYEVLLTAAKNPDIPDKAQKGIVELIGLVQKYGEIFKETKDIAGNVKEFLEETAFDGEVVMTSDTKEKAGKKLENIESLVNGIAEYQRSLKEPTLKGYLDRITLMNQEDTEEEEKKEGVTLLSIHSAKGLEFPFVYIVGMEQGILPHYKSVLPHEIEEERRLSYVAITRAREELTISYALARSRQGRMVETQPSLFLAEIPTHLLDRPSDASHPGAGEEGFAFYQRMKEKLMADSTAKNT
ncbi:MAG: UvrD-helicase domain-containing protein [Spirochaetes bacterium]|nr:UvrD-helicase domain-containing protein [Spirochaetota bacterium]